MAKLLPDLVRQFSSPRVWVEQIVWSMVLAAVFRFFLWIFGVVLDPEREVAFWLGVPVIGALGFSVLRTLGGYADLRAVIEQVSTITGTDGSEAMAITCTIRNVGRAPSSATHWRGHLHVAGSPVTHDDLVPIQFVGTGFAIEPEGGGMPMLIPNSELMHNKGSQGVSGGGYIAGIIVCPIPEGVEPGDVLRAGTKISVTFQDVYGANHRVEHVASGVMDREQRWIPGITRVVPSPASAAKALAPGKSEDPKKMKSPRRSGQKKRPR